MAELFDDRYGLLDAKSARLHRARDVVFDRIVAVMRWSAECFRDPADQAQLTADMRALQRIAHPHVLRCFSFIETEAGPVLVREWAHGFSLLDLLRKRRKFSVAETVSLLAELPETLDFITAQKLPMPADLLKKALLDFGQDHANWELPDVSGLPLQEWPPYSLKLNLIRPRDVSPTGEGATVTMVRSGQERDRPGTAVFAELLYEMLGGRRGGSPLSAPLSALSEEANAALRACSEGLPPDCVTFWKEFTHALDIPDFPPRSSAAPRQREPLKLRIPTALRKNIQSGTKLILNPVSGSTSPIHLIARPRFRIGRAREAADFTARLFPENSENYELTGEISRVHVLGEISSDGQTATLRDGSGDQPSRNGSSFDGIPLSADMPTALHHRGVLSLANVYWLEVFPLFQNHLANCEIRNLDDWPEPETPANALKGAVAFTPLNGQKPLRDAAWIFSGIGFGLHPGGALIWDLHGDGESPAAFLHHRGCFWIKNTSLTNGVLALGDIPIAEAQVASLASGQTLQLGQTLYSIEVS